MTLTTRAGLEDIGNRIRRIGSGIEALRCGLISAHGKVGDEVPLAADISSQMDALAEAWMESQGKKHGHKVDEGSER